MHKRKFGTKYLTHSNYITCKKKSKSRSRNESDSEDEEEKDNGIGLGELKNLMNSKIDCIGNHIWFNDDVDGDSVSKLIKIISGRNFIFERKQKEIFYGKLTPIPLFLHINSDGGDLQEGMVAVDAIRNSKIPIYTIIEGRAASAASLISVAGKKRFMTEHSDLLIHQLSGGYWGTYQEMKDEQENNDFFMEKIYSFYQKYTNLPKKRLEKIMKRDIWWNYKKALKYGFVDAIYTSDENAINFSKEMDIGDESDNESGNNNE